MPNAGLRAPEHERMDVAGAFERVDGFHIHHMTDYVEFIPNAVAAMHVARHTRDLERLPVELRFMRTPFPGRFALLAQAAYMQAGEQPDRDFALHVGELFWISWFRRQRAANCLRSTSILGAACQQISAASAPSRC